MSERARERFQTQLMSPYCFRGVIHKPQNPNLTLNAITFTMILALNDSVSLLAVVAFLFAVDQRELTIGYFHSIELGSWLFTFETQLTESEKIMRAFSFWGEQKHVLF